MPRKNIVDRIVSEKLFDDNAKVIKLYAVAVLNYRQPLGNEAWAAMRKIIGNGFESVVFLLGFNLAGFTPSRTESLKGFLKWPKAQ